MRRLKRVLGPGLLVLIVAWIAPAVPGGSEVVLLDAPRGAWVASVRADAVLTVLEERDGWRRVRIEGWTAAGEAGPATSATETAPTGAAVRGVLLPLPGQKPDTVGAGLIVVLLDDLERLGSEHRALGEECRSGVKALDARIADRDAALRKALNSSDNFTTAAKRHDKAKADLAAARKERADYVARCIGRADEMFGARASARAISDASGRFEFPGVAPGRYWVMAGEHHEGAVRAWWLEFEVTGSEGAVLDPRSATSVGDPYWGLR